MDALHTCDNKMCVNPDHLYAGDHSQNMRDAYARGRKLPATGPRKPYAKLTDDEVNAIRLSSDRTVALAKRYGASTHYISAIKNNRARV
jgi:hypothetical protein